MFDVSLPEFVICAVIGLLVLGPKRLPKVAAEIGKWVGRARRTATQLRRQLEREIELSELEEPPAAPRIPPERVAGEVPPGPGTHVDRDAAAAPPQPPNLSADEPPPAPPVEQVIKPPAAPDADSRVADATGSDWGSRERYGTTDKPNS
jgi:sec-independent protein translocase protein TatB